MADAAERIAGSGYAVRVLASARGYEDPTVKYPSRELRNGVEIKRLPLSSFGKKTILLRLVGQTLFLIQAIVRGLLTPRLCGILVSTSPPMCSIAALIIATIRRVPIKFWVMDINPDQLIALGKTTDRSLAARAFNALNRRILRRATDIVVLDRFMAERVRQKADVADKLSIIPPWPHVDALQQVPKAENPFVAEHGLREKFVVMYSGNHSIASPLTTLLQAALRLQDDRHLQFMFVGGGLGKREVDETIREHQPDNIVSLPYQPLDQIQYSLSAADLHVVALGDPMVGIIHPCKIYGAMAVGRPVLLLGPQPSHAADLIEKHEIGWQVAHGNVDGMVETLKAIVSTAPDRLAEMGQRALHAARETYSKQRLGDQFADVVARGLTRPVAVPAFAAAAASNRLEGRRVLLLGADDFLAPALSAALEARGAADVLAPPEDEFDLSLPDHVQRMLDETQPQIVVQLAGARGRGGHRDAADRLESLVREFTAEGEPAVDFHQFTLEPKRSGASAEARGPQESRSRTISAELFGPRSLEHPLPRRSVEQLIADTIRVRDAGQAVLGWHTDWRSAEIAFVGEAAEAVADAIAQGEDEAGAVLQPSNVSCAALVAAVADLCAYDGQLEISYPDGTVETIRGDGVRSASADLPTELRAGLIETIAWTERSVAAAPGVSPAAEVSDAAS